MEEGKVNQEKLTQAVDKLQKTVLIFNEHFKFKIHEKTHRVQVQVIDSRTNEVVNEIPPDKILSIVEDLQNFLGLVIDKKA